MLLRFAVQNFMSFDKTQEFSMSAASIIRHEDHIKVIGKHRILKGGFIYGANASGKSNLIKAIRFSRDIILKGINNVDTVKKYFRLCPENYTKPGVFQYDIIIDKILYSYGFALSYKDNKIIDEWLYQTKSSNEKCIFSRETNDNIVTVHSDFKLSGETKNMFDVYKNDITHMEQDLFLTEIARKSIKDIPFFDIFNKVFRWYTKLIIIFPNSKYMLINQIADNEKIKKNFYKYLKHFDTGIDDLINIEIDFDKYLSNIDDDVRTSIKNKISKDITIGSSITLRTGIDIVTLYKTTDGDIKAKKMMINNGNSKDLFDLKDESDGTVRLFDLIPLFFDKNANSTIFIDEIDRSLHPNLTEEFIKIFYEHASNNNSQLIVTTHDSALMNLDLIRQDEIWFIKRDSDHSSHIYSMDKYKPRFDKKVQKDYLIGRYDAVPIFTPLTDLNNEGCNEK